MTGGTVEPGTGEVQLPQPVAPAPTAGIPSLVWLGILGVVVIAVIVTASLMFPPSGNGNPPAITVAPTPEGTAVVPTPPTTIPTTIAPDPTDPATGMKIYRSNAYQFSIDYPTGWEVSDSAGIVSFSPTNDLTMGINRGYSSATLQDFFLQNAKRITSDSNNNVMNHDFKTNIGYRIDYIISKADSISKTRVTEIYAQAEEGSDILVITISGSENAYSRYSGDIDKMIRSFSFMS